MVRLYTILVSSAFIRLDFLSLSVFKGCVGWFSDQDFLDGLVFLRIGCFLWTWFGFSSDQGFLGFSQDSDLIQGLGLV